MRTLPKVFISATSGDLGSVRSIVKNALLAIGCQPIEELTYESNWRLQQPKLRAKIGSCQALLHIVGTDYGEEPMPASRAYGEPRQSFAQLEHQIGRGLQKKRGDRQFRVYTFVCPDDFPFDNSQNPESAHKHELQQRYREEVLMTAPVFDLPIGKATLEQGVLALRDDLLALQRRQTQHRGLSVATLLITGVALGAIGNNFLDVKANIQAVNPASAKKSVPLPSAHAELEAIISAISNNIGQRGQLPTTLRYDQAISEITAGQDAQERALRATVEKWAATVEADAAASPYDSALVAYKASRFEQAAEQAGLAYEQAVNARQVLIANAIMAARLEGDAYFAALRYEDALAAFRKSADLADQDNEPLVWAKAQHRMFLPLFMLARYSEAETLLRASISVYEQQNFTYQPETAISLSGLAQVLQETNRLSEAEQALHQAMAIDKKYFGDRHPAIARDLFNLGLLLESGKRADKAEPLMRSALALDEEHYGKDHSVVALDLNNLAALLLVGNRPGEAERLVRRAWQIDDKNYGKGHPDSARNLHSLALISKATKHLGEAEKLMRQALEAFGRSYGDGHPKVATALGNLATIVLAAKRPGEAEPLLRKALAIDEQVYGSEHPKVAYRLNRLAASLQGSEHLTEAETLFRRALAIDELSLGAEHPKVARDLNNLAWLLNASKRSVEAEPLHSRAALIGANNYKRAHPNLAGDIDNLAQLLNETGHLGENEELTHRAVLIALQFSRVTSQEHPQMRVFYSNYRALLAGMKLPPAEISAKLEKLGQEAGFEAKAWQKLQAELNIKKMPLSEAASEATLPVAQVQ
jgi:tetratricopeptide (TPR) repeat protein